MSDINLVFATDKRYVQHLIVTLTSIFENMSCYDRLVINIIDGGINEVDKDFLNGLCHNYGVIINYLSIDSDKLKDVVVNGHITEATYYRILIPELLDRKISKVIYLDCDLIIRDDISKLWAIDIGSHAIGAIKINEYINHDQLGIPANTNYFNAGVLVMNLDKWRQEKIGYRVMDFIKNYSERLIMWDQDALNAILYNDFYNIDYSWNLRTQLFELDFKTAGFSSNERFQMVKSNPSIVHFTTYLKPWHYASNHPFKDEYFKYLDLSKYPYVKFPEMKTIVNKTIVLFGTGKSSEIASLDLKVYPVEIAYYADNNSSKWGTQFLSKEVINPQDILKLENPLIVIASQYDNEISIQLESMGFQENKQFVRNLLNITDVK